MEDVEKVLDIQKDKYLVQFKNKKVDFVYSCRELNQHIDKFNARNEMEKEKLSAS
jgi:hypothetical protein